MSNGGNYYALTLTVEGASTPAYYSLNPTSNLEISQGGVTFVPTGLSMTSVSIYPQELSLQAPAGLVSAGVTIITSADLVTGRVVASPPVSVSVVVTLYGNGGVQLGQFILDPGVESGNFSFPSDPSKGMPQDAALSFARQHTVVA